MTDPDLIEWSAKDYSMRDFISKVKNSLPVLVITTTGQSGCDDTLHEVGAGEMYWVFGIQMQKRAVARTCDKKYLSIPAEHPLRFHLIDSSGKWGKNTTSVARLIDLLQKGSHDIEMMPEKNKNLSFMIGANTGSIQRFDAMTLIDTYEEKYLLAYSVHAGAMHSITVGIPVYMDIMMDIAVGFKYGTQQQFIEWFAEVKRIASHYVATPIETCKEVKIFENIPADGYYEYVYLKNYVNLSNKTDAAYVQLSSTHVANNLYSQKAQAGPTISKRMSELTGSSNPEKNYSRNLNSSRKLCQKTILPLMPDEKARAHIYKIPNKQYVNLTYKLEDQGSGVGQYNNIRDVPVDVDVNMMTIDDVSNCLQLLNLCEYREIMRNECVDGSLLKQLTCRALVDKFGFSEYAAARLKHFMDGWRPLIDPR